LTLPVMRIVLLPVLPGRDTTPRPKPAPVDPGAVPRNELRGRQPRIYTTAGTKKDRVVLRP
jgi:hypothetical protein